MHRRHAHHRHRWHKECGRHLRTADRLTVRARHLRRHRVRTFARRRRFRRQLDLHRPRRPSPVSSATPAPRLWQRRERPERRLQLRLGVHQEIRRAHNPITRREPLQDHNRIVNLRTHLHVAGFEHALPAIKEGNRPRPRLQHARCRNHQLPPQRHGDVDIHVHPRLQHDAGIAEDQANAHRPCGHVNFGEDLIDASAEVPPRIRIDAHLRRIVRLQPPHVALEHIRSSAACTSHPRSCMPMPCASPAKDFWFCFASRYSCSVLTRSGL